MNNIPSPHRSSLGYFLPIHLAVLLVALCVASPEPVRADTIFLKDGSQIPDCKVTSESASHVSVKTPVGDMVVPMAQVHRILKTKTIQDTFKEQRAAIRDKDVNGLFKLATWCRSANGLRQESDELLGQVIALNPNHAGARRLLGHVKLDGEWVVLKPLSLRLKASGPSAEDLRTSMDLLLQSRKDVRLAPDSDSRVEADDPFDACTINAGVIISRQAGMVFYGVTVGEPSYMASVRLEAHSPWIGKTLMKTAAEGQVPGAGGNNSLAVHNAFGTGSSFIHRLLDQVNELRMKKVEEDFQKKKREKKAPATPAKPASASR
jgi:hypothetical protein